MRRAHDEHGDGDEHEEDDVDGTAQPLLQARQLGVDDRNRTDGQQTQPAEGHREIGSGVHRSDEGRESVPGPAQSRVERIDDVCAVEGQCGAVEEDEDP